MKIKKFLLVCLVSMASIETWANDVYDFQESSYNGTIQEICYKITSNTEPYTVEVTHFQDTKVYQYYGDVWVPSKVLHNGITYTVTSIGEDAFRNCESLETVTLPATITFIDDDAFKYQSLLWITCDYDDINIYAKTPPVLGTNVFSGEFDATVHIPKGLMETYMRSPHWSSWRKIDIVADLEWVDLENDEIEQLCVDNFDANHNGVMEIEEFEAVTDLGSIFKGAGFTDFDFLKYFTGLTSIDAGAFSGCTNMTRITIPKSVSSIDADAFSDCKALETISVDPENTKLDSRNDCNAVIEKAYNRLVLGCKNTVIPDDVKAIGKYAFYGRQGLKEVSLPNTVTSIETFAFAMCTDLTAVTLGDNVKIISGSAFHGCSKLSKINIPDGMLAVSDYAFTGCTSLPVIDGVRYADTYLVEAIDKDVDAYRIKTGTRWIGPSAFYYCTNAKEIIIPASVTEIHANSFIGCKSLTDLYVFATKPPMLYDKVFNTCSTTTLHIPSGTTATYKVKDGWKEFTLIEENSVINFADTGIKSSCVDESTGWDTDGDGEISYEEAAAVTYIGKFFTNNTTALEFDELKYFISLETIDTEAFSGCTQLKSISLPSSVVSIGADAFGDCKALTQVNITDLTAWLNIDFGSDKANPCYYAHHLFLNGAELTKFTVPATVTAIKDYAFISCEGLTNADFHNSVTSIGNEAFKCCTGLGSVTIGSGVTEIGARAFNSCSDLTDVKVCAPVPPVIGTGDNHPFNSINGKNLYVRTKYMSDYQSAVGWEEFTSVKHLDYIFARDQYGNVVLDQNGFERTDILLPDTYSELEISGTLTPSQIDYDRTYADTEWQPLYVPFNFDITDELLEDFEFARYSGTYTDKSGNFYLTAYSLNEEDHINANTPYFIRARVADEDNVQRIALYDTHLEEAMDYSVDMYSMDYIVTVAGVYSPTTATKTAEFYVYDAGEYLPAAKGEGIDAFRFYVKVEPRGDNPYSSQNARPSKLKIIVLGGEDDPDGIDAAELHQGARSREQGAGEVYDLAGRKIQLGQSGQLAPSGLYIIGGKKVMVK